MGKRKLPRNVVEMRGNPGKRPINTAEPDPTPITGIPDPPREMKPEAVKEWKRIIGYLVINKIIGIEGLSNLATYCMMHARIVELEKLGSTADAAMIGQYRLMAGEFGLTPSGRAKLKTGNGKEKDSDEKRFFG
jgi:phage terminase small subunit